MRRDLGVVGSEGRANVGMPLRWHAAGLHRRAKEKINSQISIKMRIETTTIQAYLVRVVKV